MRAPIPSLLALVFATVATACASGEDAKSDPPPGGGTDSGVDAKVDTAPPVTACSPGETSTESCGKCGTKKRGCTPAGTWGSFGACEGELAASECSIGETRDKACGKCGTRKDTCDEKA